MSYEAGLLWAKIYGSSKYAVGMLACIELVALCFESTITD